MLGAHRALGAERRPRVVRRRVGVVAVVGVGRGRVVRRGWRREGGLCAGVRGWWRSGGIGGGRGWGGALGEEWEAGVQRGCVQEQVDEQRWWQAAEVGAFLCGC